MSVQACAVQSGPATGSVDPTCTVSAAGTSGGSQTDIYLYVTSDSSNCDTNVLAYASTCLYDLYTNRPVMSYFNVCPLALVALPLQQVGAEERRGEGEGKGGKEGGREGGGEAG